MPQNDRKIQRNFTGGEQSPQLDARADLARFANSLAIMEGFVVLPWGGTERSPGSRFVYEMLANARFLPFAATDLDGYALEFGTDGGGDGKLRFFRDFGIVLAGANPYVLDTPFGAADIPALYPAQVTDTVYLASGSKPIQKLKHVDATTWTLTAGDFKKGPFRDPNPNLNVRLYTTAAPDYGIGAALTVKAYVPGGGAQVFSADMAGGIFRIGTRILFPSHGTWEPDIKGLAVGDYVVWNGNTYKCDAAVGDHTGVNPPVHTVPSQSVWDGSNDGTGDGYTRGRRRWQFQHPGYGVVRIDVVDASDQAHVTVLSLVPDELAGTIEMDGSLTGGTPNWAEGAWSDKNGYPRALAFHGDRLFAAATAAQPNTLWASGEDDYENFDERRGEDDAAFSRTLLGNNKVHQIRWMVSGTRLAIGTTGDEFAIQGSATREPLTPDNATIVPATEEGANTARPVKIGGPIWVSRDGRRVHLLGYDFQSDEFAAPDLTEAAEHVTGADGLVDLAWQREPYQVLWAAGADGALIGLTYRKQQQVVGWHRHPRPGAVRSLACVPNPDGKHLDLWMKVEHTVGNVVRAYAECLEHFFNRALLDHDDADRLKHAWFVGCGLRYEGAPITEVEGLGHLEGLTVDILADGQVKPQQTVTAGKIKLDRAAALIVVGRPMPARLVSLKYDRDFDGGATSGRKRMVKSVALDLLSTAGLRVSAGVQSDGGEVVIPSAGYLMSAPPLLFSGVSKPIPVPDTRNSEGQITVLAQQPLPATVLSWTPNVQVSS